jgi:hypothetical protein
MVTSRQYCSESIDEFSLNCLSVYLWFSTKQLIHFQRSRQIHSSNVYRYSLADDLRPNKSLPTKTKISNIIFYGVTKFLPTRNDFLYQFLCASRIFYELTITTTMNDDIKMWCSQEMRELA